jgi:hypothetical protein
LLPELNTHGIIITKADATNRLKDMQTGSMSQEDHLNKGYQRLWEQNLQKGFDQAQRSLFHLVLCSFRPLSARDLEVALRIQLYGDKLYLAEIDEEWVLKLGEGFLFEDHNGFQRLFHDSAAKFLSDFLKSSDAETKSDQSGKPVSDNRSSHAYVAKLYKEVMWSPGHQFWKDTGYRFKPGRARNDSFARYLATWGLGHCHVGSEPAFSLDALWPNMFDCIVGLNKSAFTLSTDHLPDSELFNALRKELFAPLPEGTMAWLFAWLQTPLPARDQHLSQYAEELHNVDRSVSAWRTHYILKRSDPRFRARTEVSDLLRALAATHFKYSNTALTLIYRGIYCFSGPEEVLKLLTRKFRIPESLRSTSSAMCSVQDYKDPELLEMLLEIEVRCRNGTRGADIERIWEHGVFITDINMCTCLIAAVSKFDEPELLPVLRKFPIEGVNKTSSNDLTTLHVAAQRDFLGVAKHLYEKCHASIDQVDRAKKTAAFHAWVKKSDRCFEYLQEQGALVDWDMGEKSSVVRKSPLWVHEMCEIIPTWEILDGK